MRREKIERKVHKKKFRGLKVKFYFMDEHEVIKHGDLYIHGDEGTEMVLSRDSINSARQSTAIGDTPLDHPNRIYIRLI